MSVYAWAYEHRDTLAGRLAEAVVVQPVAAIEQHGHHLATGTDSLLLQSVLDAALPQVRAERDIIVAPMLCFGASDHHLPFGGTLSLSVETMVTVLLELARSVQVQGGRRWLVLNGHGGNRGPIATAIAAAHTRYEMSTASLDYWNAASGAALELGPLMPGHAGIFETSMMLAAHGSALVAPAPARVAPQLPAAVGGGGLNPAGFWRQIDGFTDDPSLADADAGRRWLDECATVLARQISELAGLL